MTSNLSLSGMIEPRALLDMGLDTCHLANAACNEAGICHESLDLMRISVFRVLAGLGNPQARSHQSAKHLALLHTTLLLHLLLPGSCETVRGVSIVHALSIPVLPLSRRKVACLAPKHVLCLGSFGFSFGNTQRVSVCIKQTSFYMAVKSKVRAPLEG